MINRVFCTILLIAILAVALYLFKSPWLYLLYLALPAFAANMMPVVAARYNWLPHLAVPIDNERKIFGQRVFGQNKTLRGLAVGIIVAVAVSGLQYFLHQAKIAEIPFFTSLPIAFVYGFLAGAAALSGDLAKSFVKRQKNYSSGELWWPWDHIDYMAGFLLATHPLVRWDVEQIIVLILFASVANPVTNSISHHWFKIKSVAW